jgi:hypothetical protein
MRFTLGISTVTLLLVFATAGSAQDTPASRRRPADAASPADRSTFKQRASGEAPDNEPSAADEVIQGMIERVRPIESRLRDDHRLRKAESLIGLGVVAYEALRKDPRMPLGYVGTQALRMGLHRQLATIRQRSGYEVEPSIGRRSFAVAFRRTFE